MFLSHSDRGMAGMLEGGIDHQDTPELLFKPHNLQVNQRSTPETVALYDAAACGDTEGVSGTSVAWGLLTLADNPLDPPKRSLLNSKGTTFQERPPVVDGGLHELTLVRFCRCVCNWLRAAVPTGMSGRRRAPQ
jgi:hypothetical protein